MLRRRISLLTALVGIIWVAVYFLGLAISLIVGFSLVVGVAALFIHYQETILYIPVIMGYKTVSDNPEGFRSPAEWGVDFKDFYLGTIDTHSIHGWHIKHPSPIGTVIFCHENAGNIGLRVNNLVAMSKRLCVDVVAYDYRGYGFSSGKPTEEGLIRDTDAVYLYVMDVLKASNVFVYGRSLGGAVALHFASLLGSRGDGRLKGVIVENTFTSISDMVGSVFPLLNVDILKKYFLRLKWDTAKALCGVRIPIMLVSGLQDEIVPASHMASLHKICDRNKLDAEMVVFPQGKHNDTWVVGGSEYWGSLEVFLKKRME
jgi:pimeloyl-ACP methyl ester carboxylesterase